jgi:hypothetical protein
MQISERVRLVGSGELGFLTSHPLDCNVFLLDGGHTDTSDAPTRSSRIWASCPTFSERLADGQATLADAPQETSYPCLSGPRSTDWCGAYHSSRIRRAVLPKPRAA